MKCQFQNSPDDPSIKTCSVCGRVVNFPGDPTKLIAVCGKWKPGPQVNVSSKVMNTDRPEMKSGCGSCGELKRIQQLPEAEREKALAEYRAKIKEQVKKLPPEKLAQLKAKIEARRP